MALQNYPELGKMARLLSSPHWTQTASGKRCDLGQSCSMKMKQGTQSKGLTAGDSLQQSLPGRGWSVSCCHYVCVCVRVNQIVVQMHSLLWVLVKAVCKPLASLGCASA